MLFNLDSNSITITHIGSVFLYYLYSIRAQYISYTRTKIIGSPITYQDFLAAQEAEAHPTDLVQLSALQTLFSDPSANVSQIAQQAAAPILKALDETPGVPVYTSLFWRAVAAAVRDLPQYNDKLVEFVVEFQKVPSPDDYISYMTDFMRHWTEFEFHCK
jgi:hypothetical protein